MLTLNRPEKRNALDPATIEGIGQTLVDVAADPSISVLVFTGAGDKAFCSGMDLASFAQGRQQLADSPAVETYHSLFRRRFAKPVIVAVNGAAVGGGFELMLACDLVVAAEHAQFGLPEVKRGLFAGAGGTLISRRIPMAIALELGLTGELISAARAYELGLVNRVVPAERVVAEAMALAEAIAANAPLAVKATKSLMYDTAELPDSQAWVRIADENAAIVLTDDAREGARAFVEKRSPRWRGC